MLIAEQYNSAHNWAMISAHNWAMISAHNWAKISAHNWAMIIAHNWASGVLPVINTGSNWSWI